MPLKSRGTDARQARTPTPTPEDEAAAQQDTTVQPRRGRASRDPTPTAATAGEEGSSAPAPQPETAAGAPGDGSTPGGGGSGGGRAKSTRGRPPGSTSKVTDEGFDPRAARERLRTIEADAKTLKTKRIEALKAATTQFDEELLTLEAEHGALTRQLSSSLFR